MAGSEAGPGPFEPFSLAIECQSQAGFLVAPIHVLVFPVIQNMCFGEMHPLAIDHFAGKLHHSIDTARFHIGPAGYLCSFLDEVQLEFVFRGVATGALRQMALPASGKVILGVAVQGSQEQQKKKAPGLHAKRFFNLTNQEAIPFPTVSISSVSRKKLKMVFP